MMQLKTKFFGEVSVDESESLLFTAPIYGFEDIDRYIVLTDSSVSDSPFCWLQAVEHEDVCFVLTQPEVVCTGYRPCLSPADRALLELSPDEEPIYRLITILPEDISQATVNLKSPIAIHPAAKRAAQIILEADYHVRSPLVREEDGAC